MEKKYDVAIVACIMDMTHAGHIELLKLMKEKANKVWLFLHDDKSAYILKNKFPIQSLKHRKNNLFLTGLVDEIIDVYYTDPAPMFEIVILNNPNTKFIYVRGDDTLEWPGKEIIKKYNIPIFYKKYTDGVSSTKLRDELNQ